MARRAVGQVPARAFWAACCLVFATVAITAAGPTAFAATGDISTFAGSAGSGTSGDGGPATSARFQWPTGVAQSGGNVYVADLSGARVRAINAGGIISTFAGTGASGFFGDGGAATSAWLADPTAVEVDAAGNLYIADAANRRVRKVSTLGVISTIAGTGTAGYTGDGGPATAAQMDTPAELALDDAGNLLVSDAGNHTVRRITPAGVITTVAGTGTAGYSGDGGPATAAALSGPRGLTTDRAGNLYVADAGNHRVRRITPGGTISTLAGTGIAGHTGNLGPATSARLNRPWGLEADSHDTLFLTEVNSDVVRKVTGDGVIHPVAGLAGAQGFSGDGGPGTSAQLHDPRGLTIEPDGDVLFADTQNRRVRRLLRSAAIEAPTPLSTTPASPSNVEGVQVSGSTQPGWTVSLYTNAACSGGAVATGTSAAFASPGLSTTVPSNATTTFWAKATDAFGTTSGCSRASVSYIEDSTPPAAPALGATPATPSAERGPSWSFSGEADASFECQLTRGTTTVSAYAPCASPKRFSLTGQPDGTYTFAVRATDAAGNTGTAATHAYLLDTTAPAAPTVTTAPGPVSNGTSPAWSFTGESGATRQCQLAKGPTVLSAFAACTSPRFYDISAETDGVFTFSVRDVDAAGNIGQPATSTYTLDRAAPAAPTLGTVPASPGRTRSPSWSFSGEAGATFECRVTRGGATVQDWTACASPREHSLSGQPDGVYSFAVRARDTAGNLGVAASHAYELDTTGPAAPTFTAVPGSPTATASPSWSFTAEAGASFECRLTRGATVASDWAPCASPKGYSLAGLPDGTYSFSVRATDIAGNTGVTGTSNIVVDRSVPNAPTFTGQPTSPGNTRGPAWAFAGDAGATFECRVQRDADGAVLQDWVACNSPSNAVLTGQADGSYTFAVRARNAAGTAGPARIGTYVLDTTGPAGPTITAAPTSPTATATPSWSFTGEAGASFECRLTRGADIASDWTGCSSPRGYALAGQPDGAYTFAVRAIDVTGNTGAATTSTVTVDRSIPSAPVLTGRPAAAAGRDRVTAWSFTGDGGATFECRAMRGSDVVFDWSGCASPASLDLTGQPDATYTFAVRARNWVGTPGPETTGTYELDTTGPAAPAVSAAPSSPTASDSPAWSFTGAVASYECRLTRGGATVDDWNACGSPASYALGGEPDGVYRFEVRGVDAVGNRGASARSDVTVDRSVPPAPTFTAEPDSPGSGTSPSWTLSGAAGTTLECRLTRGATVLHEWTGCGPTYTAALAGEPDGTYELAVRARNAAGTAGPPATATYLLDSSVPAAPSFTVEPPATGSGRAPSWSFTGEAGATFECRLTRGSDVLDDWTGCGSPHAVDLTGLPDGAYTLAVRAVNWAGTTGAATSGTYVLDTADPPVPSFAATPSARTADPRLRWAFSGETGATFQCRLTREGTLLSDWDACVSEQLFDLTSGDDGSYAFDVRAVDAAGNDGLHVTSNVVLDRDVPSAPTFTAEPASPGRSRTPSWSFNGDAGDDFECRVTRDATEVEGWGACSSAHTVDLEGEPDGAYTLHLRGRNATGTAGPAVADGYVLDTTAPVPPTLSSTPASPTAGDAPAWGFSGEAGATFECRVTRAGVPVAGWDWRSCTSPQPVDLAGEPDGTYTFAVRAIDLLGNTGSPATAAPVVLDRSEPGAPTITARPSSPARDTTPAWSFTVDAETSPECRVMRGTDVVSDWAPCASGADVALGGGPDGSYSFAVRSRNAADTAGPAVTEAYALDTMGPAAPTFTAVQGSPTASSSVDWAFSAEAGSSFECRLSRGGTDVVTWSGCGSPASFDLAAEPDGVYTFEVSAIDGVGNVGAVASRDVTLDRSVPAAPAFTAQPASPGRSRSPAWSFTGDAGATLECRLARGDTVLDDWAPCGSPTSVDLSGRPDGAYVLGVRARNWAGTTGPAVSGEYVLDTTPPAAPAITAAPASPTATADPAWSFTAAGATLTECRLTRGSDLIDDWGTCTSPQGYGLAGEPDGTYTFAVRGVDAVGNVGSEASSVVAFDRSVPAVPAFDARPASPGGDRTPSWSFTGDAGAGFECRLTSGAAELDGWRACSSPHDVDLIGRPDGTYTLAVRARNAAGTRSAEVGDAYVFDTSVPAAPRFTAEPHGPDNDRAPAWSFSGDAGTVLQCSVTHNGVELEGWTTCSSPRGLDLSSAPDGTYRLRVRARNAAGTVGPSAATAYELDTAAPAAPIITTAPPSPYASAAPSWSFTDEAGASFECRLTRDSTTVDDWTSCASPYAASLVSQPDGTYTFAVRATDGAGNMSGVTTSAVVVDRFVPPAPDITAAPRSPSPDRAPAWSFSVHSATTAQCRLARGPQTVSEWAACASPWTVNFGGQPDGAYTVAIRARSTSGVVGPEATRDHTLDTGAPPPPTFIAAPGALGSGRAPTWSFAADGAAAFECRLERADEVLADWTRCGTPWTADLSGAPDATYILRVRGVDAAGNIGESAASAYRLDSVFDGLQFEFAPGPLGRDRSPAWTFTAEQGAALSCVLTLGDEPVAEFSACASPLQVDLSGRPDGLYRLWLRGLDAAGNPAPELVGVYELDTTAPAPRVTRSPPDSGRDETPAWSFAAEPGARAECRLDRGPDVVRGWTACVSPVRFDLRDRAEGTYRLGLRATDAAGNTSATASDNYRLRRATDEQPRPGREPASTPADGDTDDRPVSGAPGFEGRAAEPREPAAAHAPARRRSAPSADAGARPRQSAPPASTPDRGGGIPGPAPGSRPRRPRAAAPAAGAQPAPKARAPRRAPERSLAEELKRPLAQAARVVAEHPDKTVFPAGLLFVVLAFLGVQGRMDRSDPKLALAPVYPDPYLDFEPPTDPTEEPS